MLPVDPFIPAIREALDRRRAVVVSAAPGAGKTTRVPPALAAAGPVILLQPRRVAARAVARRIAEEQGWTPGEEVGWQIRFERRFTPRTRLLVVTEGILTARLQQDPLLSSFGTVVLDEFHERSLHADLGLALARQAWLARDDLRIVVMSATLEVDRVAGFLDGCPVVQVPGTLHPLTCEYAPGEPVAEAVRQVRSRTGGSVLVFLPGAREIQRAQEDLRDLAAQGCAVLPLHGSLDGAAQDAALAEAEGPRVILATNIAETSLTVPGVRAVIDTGLVKVARHDAARGVDSLVTERVTGDSADQRAGRAARLGPGLARRLWDARDRLRPHREPDIARVDLAAPVLDLLAWGATPDRFEWFEAPRADRLEAAIALLLRLGAATHEGGTLRITPAGRQIQRLPLHPRLARVLLHAGGAADAAAACALLAEGVALTGPPTLTSCDLLPLVDAFPRQPARVRQVAQELARQAEAIVGPSSGRAGQAGEAGLRHALFAGYADRLGRRRAGGGDRVLLASGHGATLGRESGVRDAGFLVALDVVAAEREGAAEARIRLASAVDDAWITPDDVRVEHRVDPDSGRVRASRVSRFGAIVLAETPVTPDPAVAAPLLAEAWLSAPPDDRTAQLLRRLAFAGVEVEVPALAARAAGAASALGEIDLASALDYETTRALAAQAPDTLVVPSGRTMRLVYEDDGSVSVAVKLQEVFGLADSPRLGPGRVPVTFHLLAPNGRPVQTTRDLRSFWNTTYADVRKELRGRYPKHPWPEDPWSAPPTHRARPRG